jgi:hypothetical protein
LILDNSSYPFLPILKPSKLMENYLIWVFKVKFWVKSFIKIKTTDH